MARRVVLGSEQRPAEDLMALDTREQIILVVLLT